MAELDDFMKNITKLVKAIDKMDKGMTSLAKSATKSATAFSGGSGSMGSNSGNLLANSFGLGAQNIKDPLHRTVKTAAFGQMGRQPDGTGGGDWNYLSTSGGYFGGLNAAGREFRKMGMGQARFSASDGLNKDDLSYNQRLADNARDRAWNKRSGVYDPSLYSGKDTDTTLDKVRNKVEQGRAWAGSKLSEAVGGQGITRQQFALLPTSAQQNIASAMPTPMDSLNLMSGIQNAMSTFLPDVGKSMTRATGYYNATRAGGNQTNRSTAIANTFDTMYDIGGISSVGSDANVAEYLAQRGMTSAGGDNSTYKQTVRAVANASKYMNISNEAAAQSIEGLTSGAGSGNMLRQLGIYTADLSTGKEKTQGQIFEEVAQRLTAGRRGATVEQTQASIRRGTLGSTISGLFQDETTQQMFKQYMIDRAAGKSMDLSNEGAMQGIYGGQGNSNRNPLNAQMTLNANETQALGMAQDEYIKGMEAAVTAIGGLQKAAGVAAATMMGFPNALMQTLMGNSQIQGITQGAQAVASYASKGIAGIQEAILGGEYDTPWGGAIAGAQVMQITASTAAGAIPAITSTAGQFMMGAASSSSSLLGNTGSTGQPNGNGNTVDVSSMMSGAAGRLKSGTGGENSGTEDLKFFDPTNTRKLSDGGGYLAGTHNGYDYHAPFPPGRPVYAVYDGQVVQAAPDKGAKGTHIIIDHGNIKGKNVYSHYYHLSQMSVSRGQSVSRGSKIGTSGATGSGITGPHLHVAIAEGGMFNFVNPGKYLTATGGAGVYARTGKNVPAASGGAQSVSVKESVQNSTTSAAVTSTSDQKAAAKAEVASMMSGAPQAQGAIGLLTKLYSGNKSDIVSAIGSMASGMGFSLNPSATYANTYGVSRLSPSVGSSTAAANVGRTSTPNNVTINVQVPDTSPSEAQKFAMLVKQFLEDNTLQTNTMKA
jgi:murein DD-endopeptidase MepM/ murein hydrolase activator NlpD